MPCTRFLGVKRLPAEKVLKHTLPRKSYSTFMTATRNGHSCGGCGKSRGGRSDVVFLVLFMQPRARASIQRGPARPFIHRRRPHRVIWLLYSNYRPDPLFTVCQQFFVLNSYIGLPISRSSILFAVEDSSCPKKRPETRRGL